MRRVLMWKPETCTSKPVSGWKKLLVWVIPNKPPLSLLIVMHDGLCMNMSHNCTRKKAKVKEKEKKGINKEHFHLL
jgi:hypothetical protein